MLVDVLDMEGKNGNCKCLKYVPVLQFADCVTGLVSCSNKIACVK